MIQSNFEKQTFDPLSIEEKIKKMKFANKDIVG